MTGKFLLSRSLQHNEGMLNKGIHKVVSVLTKDMKKLKCSHAVQGDFEGATLVWVVKKSLLRG